MGQVNVMLQIWHAFDRSVSPLLQFGWQRNTNEWPTALRVSLALKLRFSDISDFFSGHSLSAATKFLLKSSSKRELRTVLVLHQLVSPPALQQSSLLPYCLHNASTWLAASARSMITQGRWNPTDFRTWDWNWNVAAFVRLFWAPLTYRWRRLQLFHLRLLLVSHGEITAHFVGMFLALKRRIRALSLTMSHTDKFQ